MHENEASFLLLFLVSRPALVKNRRSQNGKFVSNYSGEKKKEKESKLHRFMNPNLNIKRIKMEARRAFRIRRRQESYSLGWYISLSWIPNGSFNQKHLLARA